MGTWPELSCTEFGSITVGRRHDYDVVIRLDGRAAKRRKKLSSGVYRTSHVISPAEAEFVYQDSAARLIVGTRQLSLVGTIR